MTLQKSRNIDLLRGIWPYFVAFLSIFAIVYYGSRNKVTLGSDGLNMESIIANNSFVTVDQLSEFYTTAMVADSINLSTASVIRNNYESVSIIKDTGQSDISHIVKPNIVDVSAIKRGVVSYIVADGDTMESIANKYGVTTTQIRWSNGLKTDTISVGQSLLVPTYPGIAYTVKAGENVSGLAEKYKSNANEIRALNDLETNDILTVGAVILLPGGELPETERPEYVAPVVAPVVQSYTYVGTYTSANRYAYGWCTWYAWQWRTDNMGGNYILPSNMGNAYNWARAAAAAGFVVNKTPAYGAVFQTAGGYYGHVGIVTAVNGDGTITISDMNGIAGWGRVGTSTIGPEKWSQYNFIHGR